MIELERGTPIRYYCTDFQEILYDCTLTGLHWRADDINSGPISVYVYGNATPQTLCCKTLSLLPGNKCVEHKTGKQTQDYRKQQIK